MRLNLDLNRLGQINEGVLDQEKERKRIVQYLYQLTEQLRYWQYNLEEENFSEELQAAWKEMKVGMATLRVEAERIIARVQNDEEDIAQLILDAQSITQRVSDAEGNISTLIQTANGLTARVGDAEGNIASLQLTASGLTSRVGDAEGNITALQNEEIGGRNYLKNSASNLGDTSNWAASSVTIERMAARTYEYQYRGENQAFKVASTAAVGAWSYMYNGSLLETMPEARAEDKITVSAWVYVPGSVFDNMASGDFISFWTSLRDSGNTIRETMVARIYKTDKAEKGDQWVKIKNTITLGYDPVGYFRFNAGGKGPFTYYITNIKVEKGDKATDWSPAPEDGGTKTSKMWTEITQNAASITAVAGTVSDQGSDIASLQLTATGLETRVTGVENAQIGGRNYLRNSASNLRDTSFWAASGSTITIARMTARTYEYQYRGENQSYKVTSTAAAGTWAYVYNNSLLETMPEAKAGDKITVSVWIYTPNSVFDNMASGDFISFWTSLRDSGNTIREDAVGRIYKTDKAEKGGKWVKVENTITLGYDPVGFFRFNAGGRGPFTYYITNIKVEKGDKATDWSPAPEDAEEYMENSAMVLSKDRFTVSFNDRDAMALSATEATFDVDQLSVSGHIAGDVVNTQAGTSATFYSIQAAQTWVDSLGKYLLGDVTLTLAGNALSGKLTVMGFIGKGTFKIAYSGTAAVHKGGLTVSHCHSVKVSCASSRKTSAVIVGDYQFQAIHTDRLEVEYLYMYGGGYSGGAVAFYLEHTNAYFTGCNASGFGYGWSVDGGTVTFNSCIGGAASGARMLSPYAIYANKGARLRFNATMPMGNTTAVNGAQIDTNSATATAAGGSAATAGNCLTVTPMGGFACATDTAAGNGTVTTSWSTATKPRTGYNPAVGGYQHGGWIYDSSAMSTLVSTISNKTVTRATVTVKRTGDYGTGSARFHLYYKTIYGTPGSDSIKPSSVLVYASVYANIARDGTATFSLNSTMIGLLKNGTICGFGVSSANTSAMGEFDPNICDLTVNW